MGELPTLYPDINFPFQSYDAKVPSNKFRIGQAISNVEERVALIQENRINLEGITIDGNANTFLHDDGIKIEKNSHGYLVQVSVVDTPEYIIPEEKLFLEVLRRLETVYMHRYISFMLPKQIIDILSLQEGKTRPSITIEFQFNEEGEVKGHLNIFRSYFRNVKKFSDRNFAKELINFGSPFHNELHNYGELARILHRKRVGNNVRENNNFTPLHELIVSEIVLVLNEEIAKFAAENNIPIAYAHRLNGDFRYSTSINPNSTYTRITCPGRRAIDMSTLGQIVQYTESDGKEILFDKSFFNDLSRYNNTRSPYLDEQSENHKLHVETIQSVRKTKRFQKYPDQMSDEDIQYFFIKTPKSVNQNIKNEVEIRIKRKQISMHTLTYVFFSDVTLDRKIMEIIYGDIKSNPNFGYFFRVIKHMSHIDLSVTLIETKEKVKYTYEMTVLGKHIVKEGSFSISTENEIFEKKTKLAGNKTLRKRIQEEIMQEYLKEIYKS